MAATKNPLKNPPDTGKAIGIQPNGCRYLTAELLFPGEKTRKPYHRQEQTSVPVEMRQYREAGGARLAWIVSTGTLFLCRKSNQTEVVP